MRRMMVMGMKKPMLLKKDIVLEVKMENLRITLLVQWWNRLLDRLLSPGKSRGKEQSTLPTTEI